MLSGFDEATGKVSYSYTAKVLTHTGGADLHDDFGLTITDANGKTVRTRCGVAITDTAPVAAPDTNSVTEDSVPGTATGSVLTGTGGPRRPRTAA